MQQRKILLSLDAPEFQSLRAVHLSPEQVEKLTGNSDSTKLDIPTAQLPGGFLEDLQHVFKELSGKALAEDNVFMVARLSLPDSRGNKSINKLFTPAVYRGEDSHLMIRWGDVKIPIMLTKQGPTLPFENDKVTLDFQRFEMGFTESCLVATVEVGDDYVVFPMRLVPAVREVDGEEVRNFDEDLLNTFKLLVKKGKFEEALQYVAELKSFSNLPTLDPREIVKDFNDDEATGVMVIDSYRQVNVTYGTNCILTARFENSEDTIGIADEETGEVANTSGPFQLWGNRGINDVLPFVELPMKMVIVRKTSRKGNPIADMQPIEPKYKKVQESVSLDWLV